MTANKEETRGRPIEPEVQAKRLVEEVAYVRKLETKLGANKCYFASDIAAALKLVTRMERHLAKALKARTLLNATR